MERMKTSMTLTVRRVPVMMALMTSNPLDSDSCSDADLDLPLPAFPSSPHATPHVIGASVPPLPLTCHPHPHLHLQMNSVDVTAEPAEV